MVEGCSEWFEGDVGGGSVRRPSSMPVVLERMGGYCLLSAFASVLYW